MDLIFDRASGSLLDIPNPEAIRSIRQVCNLLKKIEIPCSPDREQAAFDRYVQTDKELGEHYEDFDQALLRRFYLLGNALFSRIFRKTDLEISNFQIRPKHGSGSTADRLLGNKKWVMSEWTERLESVFPYWRYGTTRSYCSVNYENVRFLSPRDEHPARVISVPKTQETPRIIAMEPTVMQYLQQGIMDSLRNGVDSDPILGRMISTASQVPNQELARRGSLDGSLATLDLSEASDRVSNILVRELTRSFPHLYDAVQATRSMKADVKGHGVITLNRFASMGSALCFPFETFVFLTIVLMGIEDSRGIHFTDERSIRSFIGQVRIYGDDIIVPVDTAPSVAKYLEAFGFKVNQHKSFWTGLFRESCGMEYFAGHDVTLTRVHHELPTSRKDVKQLVALVEFRNHVYRRGLWKTVRLLDEWISSLIPFPAVSERSAALGKTSFLGYTADRWDTNLYRPLVKAAKVRYPKRRSPLDGDAALLKCLAYCLSDSEPLWHGDIVVTSEADHLQFAGRPTASYITVGMAYAD